MSRLSHLNTKRVAVAAAVPAAVLASGAMVMVSSYSAFSAKTDNPTSSWAAGSVQLSDDDTGTALFTAAGVGDLKPGASGSKCLVVSSTGSLASTVKLYATGFAQTKSLGDHLSLKVEQGTGGSFSSCSGFTAESTAFDGTLTALSAKTDYGSAVGSWSAPAASSSSPATKTYRVTYSLSSTTPDTSQGGTASIGLTWEAQNS